MRLHYKRYSIGDRCASRLGLTLFRRRAEAFRHGILLRSKKTFPANQTSVERAQRGNRLEALVRLGGVECVSATAADSEEADPVRIHAGEPGDDVRHAPNVFCADGRQIQITRLAAASSLIGRISRDGDEAAFRQFLRIEPGNLFLYPSIRVRHTNSGIDFAAVRRPISRNYGLWKNIPRCLPQIQMGLAGRLPIRKMRAPGKLGLLGDTIQGSSENESKGYGAYYFYPATTGYPYMYLFAVHNLRAQRAFADGHVQSDSPEELMSREEILARKSGTFILQQ